MSVLWELFQHGENEETKIKISSSHEKSGKWDSKITRQNGVKDPIPVPQIEWTSYQQWKISPFYSSTQYVDFPLWILFSRFSWEDEISNPPKFLWNPKFQIIRSENWIIGLLFFEDHILPLVSHEKWERSHPLKNLREIFWPKIFLFENLHFPFGQNFSQARLHSIFFPPSLKDEISHLFCPHFRLFNNKK